MDRSWAVRVIEKNTPVAAQGGIGSSAPSLETANVPFNATRFK